MERFRKKVGWFISILLILIVLPLKWYGNIDHKRVYTDKIQDFLSKEQKIDRFGFTNVDSYNAFYEQEITYVETRTKIPFVWETKVLNSTERKLFTQSN